MPSTIERHPQKQQIIDMMLRGVPLRAIGRQVDPPVTAMALHRYKANKLGPALRRVTKTAAELRGEYERPERRTDSADSPKLATALAEIDDPLIRRVEQTWRRIDRSLDRAEAKQADGDFASTWGGVGVNLRAIELHAKLTGRLSEAPQSNTIVQIGMFDSGAAGRPSEPPASEAAGQPTGKSPNAVTVDFRK